MSSCVCWHLWVSLWHFAGPCGVSLALWVALGIHCGTLGLHFDTHGVQLGVFWALWEDLGASFRHPWAPFGTPWGPCWCLVGTVGCGPGPSGHFCGKGLKKTFKMDAKINIVHDILSFRRKWQTAFGLRLCSRIRVRAPCFHSLSLLWCPLFFQCFFDVFWGPPGASFHGVGGRGGTPYI